jgi:hypothetical protein
MRKSLFVFYRQSDQVYSGEWLLSDVASGKMTRSPAQRENMTSQLRYLLTCHSALELSTHFLVRGLTEFSSKPMSKLLDCLEN